MSLFVTLFLIIVSVLIGWIMIPQTEFSVNVRVWVIDKMKSLVTLIKSKVKK